MNAKNYSNKNAFTLIELAIVLTIIGLIAAGVVGGRSLFEAARVRKTLQQVSSYKVAYLAFKSQYDAVPGDFSDAFTYWGTACADVVGNCSGDGDGRIEPHTRESTPSFMHLSLAKLIPNTFTPLTNIWSMDNTNSPVGEWPYSIFTFMSVDTIGGGWSERANTGLWFGKYDTGWPYGVFLLTVEARNIDLKADDGLPQSGSILANADWGWDGHNCFSTNAYDVSYTSPACLMFFGDF